MEPPSAAPASSPRVFLPITHPDSPAPTYAVLQLVGYTDPSAQKPAAEIAVARTSPSATWRSGTAGNTCSANPSIFSAGSMEASRAGLAGRSGTEEEGDVNSATQDNNSPECSSAGNRSPQGSSTGKYLCSDNLSPRGSCIDSGACSSSIKGLDKKAVCIKPSLMKKTGSVAVNVGSMGVKKCGKVGSPGVTITVSHTEKETIIHTDSSNFREVVHQLTGASGNEDDLLPVTVPSRSRGSVDDASGSLIKHDIASRVPDLGPRRPAPTKLFERRRSSKTLERISTNCRDLPPLVPSPVTPLASDFERICFPITPVASPASGQQGQSNVQVQPVSSLHQIGNVQVYSSHNQAGMYMHTNLTQAQSVPDNRYSAVCGPHNGAYVPCCQQQTSAEDFVIAEKGFFLHPQRPRTSEPALLPLFPESPRGQ